jgi:hypothetical protein
MSEPSVIYTQCGVRLRSEVELALPLAEGVDWDVEVRRGPDVLDSAQPPPGDVIAVYETRGGEDWYTATKTESGYRMRFRECGEFEISSDLTRVVMREDPAGKRELLPILLAGTVSALLLNLRGHLVLHASAVAIDDIALAFVGDSGRGKSTMAALMCIDGAELITDDVLSVDPGPPVTCIGGAPELRLRDKAAPIARAHPTAVVRTTADDRHAFAPTCAPVAPRPLAAIVIPSPSRTATEVETKVIEPTSALLALLATPRVHGWRDKDVLTRKFAMLTQLVNEVPVIDATIPWGPPFDPDIARQIRKVLG